MKEINISDLGIQKNHLIHYEKGDFYDVKVPKKVNHWWGKTYFFYDKVQGNKLHTQTLSWIGVIFHKLFGYHKELNRQNIWEFFKDQHIVDQDVPCPSKEKCGKIIKEKLFNLAQKNDHIREYFDMSNASSQEKINYLKTHKLDANITDGRSSALYKAAENNDLELVRYLVPNGADINASDPNSWQVFYRPIDFAVYKGNLEMFNLFMNAGSDINAKGYKGRTPIFYALGAEAQSPNLETRFEIDPLIKQKMITEILAKKPELNIIDDFSRSPLSYAVQSENADNVRLLIENGADVNFNATRREYDISRPPLYYAILKNNIELLTLLFDNGATINPNEIPTYVELLAETKSIKILEKMLERGFPIDATTSFESKTLLHLAVINNDIDLVNFLIEDGASHRLLDSSGKRPRDYAKTREMAVASQRDQIKPLDDIPL